MVEAPKRLLLAAFILVRALEIAGQSATQTPAPTAPPFYVLLPESQTRQSISVIIDLLPEHSPFMICWYPISGNYCTLPRVLFYVTIIAALVLRHHPWLRVGALAASLTYSGAAAINACLIIWSGKAFGELDVIPLVGILSASCFVMVPLLPWPSTIRHAGKPREEKRHQEEKLVRLLERLKKQETRTVSQTDAQRSVTTELFDRRRRRLDQRNKQRESRSDNIAIASRTILLMWACLVTAGFISPGTLLTTGDTTYYWGQFFITSEFLDVNNCIDPCPIFPTLSGPLWFRDFSDLQPLTVAELIFADGSPVSGGQLSLILSYANKWSWIWVYVIIQGILSVCLGRNQRFETRIRIYGLITRLVTKRNSEPSTWTKAFAKVVAFNAYLGAIGIAVISLPLLVLNVTLIELYIHQLPQSEMPKHVGPWSPYAVIGLGLLSFIVANVQIKHHLKGFWTIISSPLRSARAGLTRPQREEPEKGILEGPKRALQKAWLLTYTNMTDYMIEQRNDILDALQEEWTYTTNFWKDSDGELSKYQQRKQETREEPELVE